MNKFIHFIGAHRNGSATLAYFFGRNFNLYSVHQTVWHLASNIVGNLKMAGLMPRFLMKVYVSAYVSNLKTKSANYSGFVETNGFNIFILPELAQQFPDLMIVHLIRNPSTMVNSQLQNRRRNSFKRLLQIYLPFWQISPRLVEDTTCQANLGEEDLIFWQWAFKNSFLLDNFADHKHYKAVFFEDLFSGSSSHFNEMLCFFRFGF